jgi:hypothetical protein
MKTYSAYLFRDKDPVIDELRTLIENEAGGRLAHNHLIRIENDGGPSVTTMRNWFFGKTRRPQSPTVEAAGRALGYRRVWQRMNSQAKVQVKR